MRINVELTDQKNARLSRIPDATSIDYREFARSLMVSRGLELTSVRSVEVVLDAAIRPGEARTVVWGEPDLDEGLWKIPKGSKCQRKGSI
jgi:hypothetical protein